MFVYLGTLLSNDLAESECNEGEPASSTGNTLHHQLVYFLCFAAVLTLIQFGITECYIKHFLFSVYPYDKDKTVQIRCSYLHS